MVHFVSIIEIAEEGFAQMWAIPKKAGPSINEIFEDEHALSKLSIVDAIVDFLETITLFQSLSIQLHHIPIVLQRYNISSELAVELLSLVLNVVLLADIVLHILKEPIHF